MTTSETLSPRERHAALVMRQNDLVHDVNELESIPSPSPGQKQRIADLTRALDKVEAEIVDVKAEVRAELVKSAHAQAHIPELRADYQYVPNQNRNVPSDDESRGLATIDDAHRSGLLPDHAAEKATALINTGSEGERSIAARWAAAAGAPDYRGAFAKLAADPRRGHLLWTPAEQDAYRAVATVHAELEGRAMSTTGANGGHMIPLSLDPSVMLSSDGSNNPLRQLARTVQTTTNAWQGVLSAGATAEWRSEAAEAADGSPTLSAPSIPVFSGDVFVPYSHEVGQDVPGFFDELTRICLDAADNLQATAFTTGDGSAAPQGIVTGLAGTASEINGGGSEALDAADPYSLQSALPARFSANASWLSHIATANTFRQMETTNGAHEFPELRDTPPMLLGKRWYECSDMDGTIDAAATANNYALIYGDIREAFIIVDRVGATVSFIEQLFSTTNGRPSGQSGLFLQFRTGAEVVNIAAARLLDVPTTA